MQIISGDVFGPSVNKQSYEIMEYLSRGGQAYIFTCKRLADGKQFAIKIFTYKPQKRERELYKQFEEWCNKDLKEFQHCVNIRDIIHLDSYALIMDQAICDLNDMKIHDPIQLCMIMRQVILGVKELHDRRIVHRDLKPENILLYRENQIQLFKITDFGISKFSQDDVSTRVTSGIGSINYAAPEYLQFQTSQEINLYFADLWSYGAVFYEKLFNQILFVRSTRKEIEHKIINFNSETFYQLNRLDKPVRILNLIKQLLSASEKRPNIAQIVGIFDGEIDIRLTTVKNDLEMEQLQFLKLKHIYAEPIKQGTDKIKQFYFRFNKSLIYERKKELFKDQFDMEYYISLVQVDNQQEITYLSNLKASVLLPHNYLINVFIFIEFKNYSQIFQQLFYPYENMSINQYDYLAGQIIQKFQDRSYEIRLEILYQIIYFFWSKKLRILAIDLSCCVPRLQFNDEPYGKYQIAHPEIIIKNLVTFLFTKEIFVDKSHPFLFNLLNDEKYRLEKSLSRITRRRKCLANIIEGQNQLKTQATINPNIQEVYSNILLILQTATSKQLNHKILYTSGLGFESANQPNFRYYLQPAQQFYNLDLNLQEEQLEFIITLVKLCKYLKKEDLSLGYIDQFSIVKVNTTFGWEYKIFQSNCMEGKSEDQQYIVQLRRILGSMKQIKMESEIGKLLRQNNQTLDGLQQSLQLLRLEFKSCFNSVASFTQSDQSIQKQYDDGNLLLSSGSIQQAPIQLSNKDLKVWTFELESEDFIKPRFLEHLYLNPEKDDNQGFQIFDAHQSQSISQKLYVSMDLDSQDQVQNKSNINSEHTNSSHVQVQNKSNINSEHTTTLNSVSTADFGRLPIIEKSEFRELSSNSYFYQACEKLNNNISETQMKTDYPELLNLKLISMPLLYEQNTKSLVPNLQQNIENNLQHKNSY